MLQQLDSLPRGFLSAGAVSLERILGGPALIHLRGRRPEPLFASVLLHGNEDVGFCAVRELLRDYRDRELPRALSLFVGNVAAARHGLRRLDGQPDYNRIWPGGDDTGSPEHAMMCGVVEEMRRRTPFVSVDVHNNTGINPHYACVNRTDSRFLHLATLFSRTVVYFLRPRGVQSMAFAELCPAVTVECGKVGQAHGVEHARDFLEACLKMSELPDHPVAQHDLDLFHTVATVKIPQPCRLAVGEGQADIRLSEDLDHLNFREIPPGTLLGRVNAGGRLCLEAWDEHGRQVGGEYFDLAGDEIRTRRAIMPSMFTADERVIRQDCLGYLMERYPLGPSPDVELPA